MRAPSRSTGASESVNTGRRAALAGDPDLAARGGRRGIDQSPAIVEREVLSRLAGEHHCRVACLAWFHDTPGSVHVDRRVALFPGGGDFGASGFAQVVREFRPDVLVGHGDLWMLAEPICETNATVRASKRQAPIARPQAESGAGGGARRP